MRRALTFLSSTLVSSVCWAQEAPPLEGGDGSESDSDAEMGTDSNSDSDTIPLLQPPPPKDEPAPAAPEPEVAPPPAQEQPAETSVEPPEDEGDKEDEQVDEESPQFGYFGIGPAMLNISGYDEYGFALAAGGRFPFHERMAVNAGVTWGLTTFSRTEAWWDTAHSIGSWTKQAYADVTQWAGEGEDDGALRYMAAFYAYIGLLFPYAVSGALYILGPFAATSYLDFHMEATFHLLETRKGPYVGAGLGTAAIIFPDSGELRGAFGPSFNLGYDFGWLGVEARGFYSPPYLHGEPEIYRTDIVTGQFLLRFQGK